VNHQTCIFCSSELSARSKSGVQICSRDHGLVVGNHRTGQGFVQAADSAAEMRIG
jgi:hypothetical protein